MQLTANKTSLQNQNAWSFYSNSTKNIPQIYSPKKNQRKLKKQIYKILHIFAKETTPPARTGDVNDNNF
jgi:hypothetical protein